MRRFHHRWLSQVVDAWVDAELDPAEAAQVAAHVRDCWDCSSAAETARLVKRSLRRLHARDPRGLASVRLRRFAQQLLRA